MTNIYPDPAACDHKWEIKGGITGDTLANVLWQCSNCGRAKAERIDGKTEYTLLKGWGVK